MKNLAGLFVVFCLLFTATLQATVYYVSTSGNDSNPGTIDNPFRTLQKISTLNLRPGDIVYIRSGVYKSGSKGNSPRYSWLIDGINGNSSNPVIIAGYPADFYSGGRVVFDCSDFSYTEGHVGILIQNSSNLLIKDIRVTGIPQRSYGQVCIGWWVNGNSGGNITLENCEADHIGNTGFRLDDTNNATFLNCDAHHIDNPYDPGVQRHGGSDGFGRYNNGNASDNTVYRGCRAWFCSDDAWDCFGSPGSITYDNCWAFWSGYVQDVFPLTHSQGGVDWGDGNGFKLGGNNTPRDYSNTKRLVKNCVAFENYSNGFDQNLANVKMEFYNNTAYKCSAGFFVYSETPSPITAKNNLAYLCNKTQNFISGVTTQSNNSWNGVNPVAGSFASLSNSGVDGPRQSNGSLPNLQFLHLSSGSNLIDAGTRVLSMLFSGSAPDIGAFEYGGSSSTQPANKPPSADAGDDITITLPVSTATLDGSGSSDADGTISSYKWAKISGGAGSISNSNVARTDVTGLAAGQYTFELTVTDDDGASSKSQVKVTVNAASNQPPVARAGNDITITLPVSTATLDGSGSSDADGSISSYKWTKISGGAGSISNSNATKTDVTGLAAGQYTFELTVTDDDGASSKSQVKVTVNAASNQPPVARAGNDITITLPASTITLDGSGSSDADGSISSYKWAKISGGAGSISNSNATKTDVTGLAAGQYTFELTVTDEDGASSKSQVKVTVNAASNQPPVARAGNDITITLPASTITLDGSGSSDADGSISSYKWAKISGGTGSISNTNVAKTDVTGLSVGQYTFELTVTNDNGASSKAQIKVTVNAVSNNNQAPVARAGADITITLPQNNITLDGSASSDADGTISSYKWSKISGGAGSISNSNVARTDVLGLTAGQYIFELTVTDDDGASSKTQVKVTVNTAAANQSPSADAGNDITVTLPQNNITLDGSASSDADGTISSYKWAKISGGAGSISNSNVARTDVTGLAAGQYTFELTVTDDDGASSKAQVKVTVNAISNKVPVANAGPDVTITLPVNVVTLDGSSSTDTDGTISSYKWAKISGGAGSISNTNVAITDVTGLTTGQYTFELTVTDDDGASSKSQVKVIVNAANNKVPVANAGRDVTITLPVNVVSLDGSSSSDADGSIASYRWTKISGGAGSISNANAAKTNVTGLGAGQYTFELTVTDDDGASSKAQVKVTVNAAVNQPPVARAGNDITITLPINTVPLDGSGSSDTDGAISTYKWTKISGGAGSISNANAAKTNVTGLGTGQYTFELTVTDDDGASSKAQVKITVNAASNKAPVAVAGNDIAITLPANATTLDGSGSSDIDGTISTYKWTKISGDAGSISNPNFAKTDVTGLVAGQYTFELTVTDDDGAASKAQVKVTVYPVANQLPVAVAGNDITITLPVNSVTLDGSPSSDADGNIVSYKWTKVIGGAELMDSPTAAKTDVTGLTAGQYTFELTVTDNDSAIAKARVNVIVHAADNNTPVADAGKDITITLPVSSASLDGTASSDADGNIIYYNWVKTDGPSAVKITNVNTANPVVWGLTAGEYIFKLTVTDNRGISAEAEVKVNVLQAANQLPVANAGDDITITLPQNSVTLDGSASSDVDDSIVSFSWTKLIGDSTAVIANNTASKTTVSGLLAGHYVFELTVTDSKNASSKAQVNVVVNKEDQQVDTSVIVRQTKTFAKQNLYPNPATDIINAEIITDSIGAVRLTIYDINGRLARRTELKPQLVSNQVQFRNVTRAGVNSRLAYIVVPVNISALQSGVYIIESVVDGKTRITSRFVKY